MRIVSFTLSRFRGITRSASVPLESGLTTLIGPNNEGKSTILSALGVALDVLSNVPSDSKNPAMGRVVSRQPTSFSFVPSRSRYFEAAYDWERDYPVALQSRTKPEPTRFEVEFELVEADRTGFRTEVKSSIDGRLPIALSVNRDGVWTFSIPKKGQGSRLSSKAPAIAQFLRRRIELQYVQAVRTADDAQRMISRYVARRILTDQMLSQIVDEVLRIMNVDAALTSAADEVCEALRPFVTANAAEFTIPKERLVRTLENSLQLSINDGSMTPLKMKGDGIVSLVSVGLARHFAKRGGSDALVLAIEEPESHLHPEKSCELRRVLADVADEHQVIITTHSPSLVQRGSVASNIIVKAGGASPAKSLREIRDALGVTLGHNLTSAELMILVEGESDATILEPVLVSQSARIAASLGQGTVAIDVLGGASKLPYRARLASRSDLYNFMVVLDDDDEGRKARDDARSDGLLSDGDVSFMSRLGARDSELEDMLDVGSYRSAVTAYFGVDVLAHRLFSSGNKKWSVRLRESAVALGRPWDDDVEKAIKATVAAAASDLGIGAFTSTGQQLILALQAAIETRMDSLGL